ncbi:hypothetical protein HDU82_002954 [Entophlyctis luteolus]|nr:hypothetical protein HDU82_002954 [Entophlyctis luteolus]
MEFLKKRGVVPRALEFKSSADKGIGLFVASSSSIERGCSPSVTVPATALLNQPTVLSLTASNPPLARCVDTLASIGHADDERLLIICTLLFLKAIESSQNVTNASDDAKEWLTYVRVLPLPGILDSTIFYSEMELSCLAGTGVDIATFAKLRKLQAEFESLSECLHCIDVGKENESAFISFDLFCWADAVFWSRVISFKSALGTSGEEDDDREPNLHLVPLIDFANHSETPEMRWVLSETRPRSISLEAVKDSSIAEFSELHISYGEKPNAELLFIHGFAIDDNPHDSVAFTLPLLGDDDEAISNKMSFISRLQLPIKIHVQRHRQYNRQTDENDDCSTFERLLREKTFGILSVQSFISLLVAVSNFEFSVEDIASTSELQAAFATHPLMNIFALRAFTILLDLIEERLAELSSVEEFVENVGEGSSGMKLLRLFHIRTLRHGHSTVLGDASNILRSVQEEFAVMDDVAEYLAANQ